MPTRMVQGQSGDATELKQRGLGFAFRLGLTVIRKWPQYRYFYFDLHAGNGFNEGAGCIGSPLSFISEANRIGGCNYFASFCDRDRDQVRSLLARPEVDNDRCAVFHGDNCEFLSMAPGIIRHYGEKLHQAVGAVLSDPNGADVPIDAIVDFAKICRKIDVIFHWNSTITKRLRNGIKPQQILLDDVVRLVPKEYWLIREPAGIHQFTILFGSNYRFGDWRSMGFYHLESEDGQRVLQRCTLSNRQIDALWNERQGDFFA